MQPTVLKLAIVSSGHSQKEIALAVGLHATHLSRIVNGLRCDDPTKNAIAAALGRDVSELWPHDGASDQKPGHPDPSSEEIAA